MWKTSPQSLHSQNLTSTQSNRCWRRDDISPKCHSLSSIELMRMVVAFRQSVTRRLLQKLHSCSFHSNWFPENQWLSRMSAKSKKHKKDNFPSRNVGSANQTAPANAWAAPTATVATDQKVVAEKKKQAQLKQFNDIRKKHIEAAKVHTENYESSSEEELENDSLLASVFKSYGGDKSQLQKTQEFLENVFQSGTATCLICIASVKRTDYVSVRDGNSNGKASDGRDLLCVFPFGRFGRVRIATVFSIWIACNDGRATAHSRSECSRRTMWPATTTTRASTLQSRKKKSSGVVRSAEQTICRPRWGPEYVITVCIASQINSFCVRFRFRKGITVSAKRKSIRRISSGTCRIRAETCVERTCDAAISVFSSAIRVRVRRAHKWWPFHVNAVNRHRERFDAYRNLGNARTWWVHRFIFTSQIAF